MADPNEAVLHYTASDFRVVRQGAYVRCAVSGARIPVDALRYWNAERQEAYASAVESFHRWRELHPNQDS